MHCFFVLRRICGIAFDTIAVLPWETNSPTLNQHWVCFQSVLRQVEKEVGVFCDPRAGNVHCTVSNRSFQSLDVHTSLLIGARGLWRSVSQADPEGWLRREQLQLSEQAGVVHQL